jgi:hypothetical protein
MAKKITHKKEHDIHGVSVETWKVTFPGVGDCRRKPVWYAHIYRYAPDGVTQMMPCGFSFVCDSRSEALTMARGAIAYEARRALLAGS